MIVRGASAEAINFGDLRVLDYTAGAGLNSSLAFIEVPAGASHPEAWSRRSDKYYLVTEGQVEFLIGDSRVTLSKGDFCHIPQGETFGYANRGSESAGLVLVHTPAFDLSAEVFVD